MEHVRRADTASRWHNGEKIIDWVNEILQDGQPPEELLQLGPALRAEWEQKEAAQEGQSRRLLRRPRRP